MIGQLMSNKATGAAHNSMIDDGIVGGGNGNGEGDDIH